MLNPMQMRSDFSRQRPIRMFVVVSDSLKMLFPRATTRPLKVMEAYRVAVIGLHRETHLRHTWTQRLAHTHTHTHTHKHTPHRQNNTTTPTTHTNTHTPPHTQPTNKQWCSRCSPSH